MKLDGVQIIDQDGFEMIPTETFYYLVVSKPKEGPGHWNHTYWSIDRESAMQWAITYNDNNYYQQKIIRIKLPV